MTGAPEIIEIPIRISTTSNNLNKLAPSSYNPPIVINETFTQQRNIDIAELTVTQDPPGTELDSSVYGDFYELGRLKFNKEDIQARIDNPSLFTNDAPLLYLEITFELHPFRSLAVLDTGPFSLKVNGAPAGNFADILATARIDGSAGAFGGVRRFDISVAGNQTANLLEFDGPGIDIEIIYGSFAG